MPYFLTGDEHARDPIWDVMARVRKTDRARKALAKTLKADHQDLMSAAAHMKSDGYLTREQVTEECSSKLSIDLFTQSFLGRAPRLHRPGDECPCLGEGKWIDGYDYRLHRYLKRNPARKEIDRKEQQKRDLDNVPLKHAVWLRDGGCCRYCRSGVLKKKSGRNKDLRKVLTFDHPDPDQPAGPNGENFVTSCKRCNTHKGRRTPAEADMRLLPEPTIEEITAWEERGQAVFELPDNPLSITEQIKPESNPDQQIPVDPTVDPPTAPDTTTDPAEIDDTGAEPGQETDTDQHDHPADEPGQCPGRVGQPPPVSRGRPTHHLHQPTRTSDAPDIYHGRPRPPVMHSPPSTPHPPPEPPPPRTDP